MKTCYLIFLSLISLFLILVPWFHSSQALHESFHDQAHENRHELDPTEFFKGSAPRPKLEIIHPENGQILDDGVLQIKIRLHGYELPSHFHDSSLCIALSNRNIEIGEQCFDQSADLDFHITGLSPRETYSLQVLFLERGRIIAMSVRSFRVGGILLDAVDGNQAVSIETAIQVGVKAQMEGSYDQAEMIYRNVLSENPSHPQALHLLGVIFIQKGDHSQAVPYIEQALVSNSTRDDSTMSYAVFHNNLGECYRYLGRIDEAEIEFGKALAIDPNLHSAEYNLGLIYQQNFRNLDLALTHYRRVLEMHEFTPGSVPLSLLKEVKIRECDLLERLSVIDDYVEEEGYDEMVCWKTGHEMFPDSSTIANELGNAYVERGMHTRAFEMYDKAATLGLFIAHLNKANVLEIQGYMQLAKESFAHSLTYADAQSLPSFHIHIRSATVTYRVLPSSIESIKVLREKMESELDAILTSPVPRLIDNVPPINYGFSTGFFFGFHGFNNRGLKSRLHRLYLIYCPALKNGYFLDSSLSSFNSPLGGRGTDGQIREEAEIGEEAGAVWLYRKNHLSSSAATVTASSTGSADMKKQYQQPPKKGDAPRTKATTGAAVLGSGKEVQSPSGSRVLRIGIASRYIYTHAVGFIVEGVVRELSSAGYIVEVFAIDGYLSRSTDVLVNKINKHAHVVHSVAADLSLFVETIRQAALDVLFYPDLGLDPIPYFAAFSRLAPIQITGLGHQDTSGISTIDYFISDELDPPGHEAFYTEKLIRMPGMGTCFYDRFISYASQLQNPRTGILERAKYIESIDIPRASHVYIIGQPLYALHPSFDQVIIQILTSDQLGQVIFLDKHPAKDSWIQLFSLRFPETIRSRLKFHSDLAFSDYLKAIGAGHVLLDPFPVSLYESSFIALSIGIPIITMPSKSSAMNNRMTLSLLSRLGWHGDGLVVSTPAEYVELALRLTHKPKVRSKFVERIISTRHKLFDCSKVVPSWRSFFQYALERKRNDTATATGMEGAAAGGGDGGVTIILPEPRVE